MSGNQQKDSALFSNWLKAVLENPTKARAEAPRVPAYPQNWKYEGGWAVCTDIGYEGARLWRVPVNSTP